MNIHRQGRISITNGSNQLIGVGTRWLTYVHKNSTIELSGASYVISAVSNNGLIVLASNYAGADIVNSRYEIVLANDVHYEVGIKINEIKEKAAIARTKDLFFDLSIVSNTADSRSNLLIRIADVEKKIADSVPVTDLVWINDNGGRKTFSDEATYLAFLKTAVTKMAERWIDVSDQELSINQALQALAIDPETTPDDIRNFEVNFT